jgi:DNA-binding IclR family transcriptional regulator
MQFGGSCREASMAHTYEELKKKTIAELREIAKDLQHEAVQGYTQMNKEHLLPAVCKALGIEAHEHHAAALAQKTAMKAKMREIKAARAKALGAGDHERLHTLRRQYHGLNHALRAAARRAPR